MKTRTRIRLFVGGLLVTVAGLGLSCAQNKASAAPEPDRLGILLDVSPEMGFLVPQARKEIRWLNERLAERERPAVPLREFLGAGLDQEGSLSIPARRNALYELRDFYQSEELDGLYWITALGGMQSGAGFFQLQEMLKKSNHQLILRNAWQDQVTAGRRWADHPPEPEVDPLHERNLADDWFEVVAAGDGYLIRSWRLPTPEFRDWFGAPHWLITPSLIKRLGATGRKVALDTAWRSRLSHRYDLEFSPEEETWPDTALGRRWLESTALVPFLDEEDRQRRNEVIFEELAARDSIAADLERIPTTKLGVLFGFGYVARDLERFQSRGNRPIRDWRSQYLADLSRIVAETRQQIEADAGRRDRVYLNEFLTLPGRGSHDARPQAFADRIAELVREHGVDALYLFTNGYTGDGDYGRFEIAESAIAKVIREAGVNLYVRVPFEFGVAPTDLHRLAAASGGAVFQGRSGDPDWQVPAPQAAWPEMPEAEASVAR